jgi:DNA-3-methyladenine glycosylase II
MPKKLSSKWSAAVAHLAAADPRMRALIDAVGPCTLEPTGADRPFESLVETIVYQQLTGKAAATIYGRVTKLARGRVNPRWMLRAAEADLRACGLSGPKIRSVRDLAARVASRELDLTDLDALDDAALAERLLTVKGIGPWSVQMMLIFRLGRPDVWPVTDLGIRKGAQKVWGLRALPGDARLAKLGKPLAPWRSVAAWYLWRSLEVGK